jgi:hypothetical protein
MKKLFVGLLVSGFLLWMLLGAVIYVYGLYLAETLDVFPFVLISFVPLIGQVYLVWLFWSITGVFFSWYTISIFIWLAFGVLLGTLVERRR